MISLICPYNPSITTTDLMCNPNVEVIKFEERVMFQLPDVLLAWVTLMPPAEAGKTPLTTICEEFHRRASRHSGSENRPLVFFSTKHVDIDKMSSEKLMGNLTLMRKELKASTQKDPSVFEGECDGGRNNMTPALAAKSKALLTIPYIPTDDIPAWYSFIGSADTWENVSAIVFGVTDADGSYSVYGCRCKEGVRA